MWKLFLLNMYKGMKKWMMTALLLMLITTVQAGTKGNDKMSADIRQLAAQHAAGHRAAGTGGGHRICAFVRFGGDAQELLEKYDCQQLTQIGDIYIARIPVAQLSAMAADDGVERIETQTGGRPTNDVSPQWTGTTMVTAGMGLPQGYDGKGVLVGIVDGGIDLTHPAFYATDGTTYRIKGFVDDFASADETIGKPTPIGREYSTQEEMLAKQHCGDVTANHGTHCLGTAAGSGYGTAYRGVASGADIFAISSKNATVDYDANSADQTARMKRIFDYAVEHHQPCVISYSIGFNDLPGDSQLFGEALSRMVGPGRILVASAGNENDHLTYVAKPAGKATAGAGMKVQGDGQNRMFLTATGNFRLKCFTIKTASGEKREITDSLTIDSSTLPADTIVMRGHHLILDEANDFYTLTVRYEKDKSQDIADILFAIEGSDAGVEAFIETSGRFLTFDKDHLDDPRFQDATHGHNIGLPASLPYAVTVGALNGRQSYTNHLGQQIESWGKRSEVGTAALFSSVGPTKAGLMKPDVMAPGVNIISAGNRFCKDSWDKSMVTKTVFKDQEYPWITMSGTSMSGPCVAGIVALWLQACPTLSPDNVKQVIKDTSKALLDSSGDCPNNTYGYGLIDAYAGLLKVLERQSTGISTLTARHAAVTLQGRTLHIGNITKPTAVTIYTLDGRPVWHATTTDGIVQLPQLSAAVYAVQVGTQGSTLIRL